MGKLPHSDVPASLMYSPMYFKACLDLWHSLFCKTIKTLWNCFHSGTWNSEWPESLLRGQGYAKWIQNQQSLIPLKMGALWFCVTHVLAAIFGGYLLTLQDPTPVPHAFPEFLPGARLTSAIFRDHTRAPDTFSYRNCFSSPRSLKKEGTVWHMSKR